MIPLLVALVGCACSFAVLWRVRQADLEQTPDTKASVIIPARNEAEALPALLSSLKEQHGCLAEILVIDDASTDETAEVAQEHGARVIAAGELPAGWRGKTWACHQGAKEAKGDVLVFLDADTRMQPNGLQRLISGVLTEKAAVSASPFQQVPDFHEQFSAFFVLMMASGVGAFAARWLHADPGLFGQCLAVSREAYDAAGGHEAVKGKTLENLFMARRFRENGTPDRCYGGRDILDVRMYPHSLRELASGWAKAFVTGAGATPLPILLLAFGWLTALMLAAIMLPMSIAQANAPGIEAWTGAYTCLALQLGCQLRRLGSFRWHTAALYPGPLLFYFAVFGFAALKHALGLKSDWKGRSIDG